MTPAKSTCKVWACSTEERPAGVMGYLITEPGQLNRMVAFIRTDGDSSEAWETTHNIASLIANDQTSMELYPTAQDLRPFGKNNSNSPMPGFVYAIWCRECEIAGGEPNFDDRLFQPNPFCRFRLAGMIEQREGKYGRTFPIDDPQPSFQG